MDAQKKELASAKAALSAAEVELEEAKAKQAGYEEALALLEGTVRALPACRPGR